MVPQVRGVHGSFANLEVAYVEVGERVVDEAVHGPVRTVHVLVNHPRDEVWGEGDDERLEEVKDHVTDEWFLTLMLNPNPCPNPTTAP